MTVPLTVPASEFVAEHWLLLVLIPLVSAFIGWITKVMAIWMIFEPTHFIGIGPFGWQGQVPARAAKFGSHLADVILRDLIDPRAMLDRLDSRVLIAQVDDLLRAEIDAIGRSTIGDTWDRLPPTVRTLAAARTRARAPEVVDDVLQMAKENVDEMFDLSYVMTHMLIEDKALLNRVIRTNTTPVTGFMKRFGLWFGVLLGIFQAAVYAVTQNHWVLPIFGFLVGLVSDWFALQMVFHPRSPRRYLGVIPWHGIFYKNRATFVAGFSHHIAAEILTPRVVLRSLFEGPLADRISARMHSQVERVLRDELRVVDSVAAATVRPRYDRFRTEIVDRINARLPEAIDVVEPYAAEVMDFERTGVEAMGRLTDEQFEGLIRPIFKDDEWIVIVVGGVLGFVVGELQVQVLLRAFGLH